MPHREPKNWLADSEVELLESLHSLVTKDGEAWVVLPDDHPEEPGRVVGEIVRIADEHLSVYTFIQDTKQRGCYVAAYTSLEYAIASIEFRHNRLSKKEEEKIECPHCGASVRTVMLQKLQYEIPEPRVIEVDAIRVLADEYHSNRWRGLYGYLLHECQKGKDTGGEEVEA